MRILLRSLYFSFMLPALAQPQLASAQVISPGSYSHHLQGIATDANGNIYWSFTTSLIKTDEEGKLLAESRVVNHHGDLSVVGDSIYVAVNLGKFNREAGQADSWVYIYDVAKLELQARHPVQEVVHGAGGMDFRNGRFYVVGGLPKGHTQNYVYEYSRDFAFIRRHEIASGYTRMGIQTAFYRDGGWWFGCYGAPRVLIRTDDDFELQGIYKRDCAYGITAGKGDTLLIGLEYPSWRERGQVLRALPDESWGFKLVQGRR